MRKNNINTGIYITNEVFNAWCDKLSIKDLSLFMLPPTEEELSSAIDIERKNYYMITMRMPPWWASWYRSLSREDKFKFAKIIEERLKKYQLI